MVLDKDSAFEEIKLILII